MKNAICLYCHDGIVEITLLWPMRQLWLAYCCHGVIQRVVCLMIMTVQCCMAREARNLSAGCYHDGIAWIKMLWPVQQL